MIDKILGAITGFIIQFIPGIGTYYKIAKAVESLINAIIGAFKKIGVWLLDNRSRRINEKLDEAESKAHGSLEDRKESNAKGQDAWRDISGK